MRLFALLFFLFFPTAAGAVQPDEQLADPALEARAREISAGLRCLVCQNQSIDDSDAPLARDLRLLVRDRLEAGDSDEEVREYVVARYGDFALLRPRFEAATVVLWLTPVIVLIAGGAVLLFSRHRVGQGDTARLSQDEDERLAHLVGSEADRR